MGTRSFYGFAVGGELTTIYRHYDGYPSCAGREFINLPATIYGWLPGMEFDVHPDMAMEALRHIQSAPDPNKAFDPDFVENVRTVSRCMDEALREYNRREVIFCLRRRLQQFVELEGPRNRTSYPDTGDDVVKFHHEANPKNTRLHRSVDIYNVLHEIHQEDMESVWNDGFFIPDTCVCRFDHTNGVMSNGDGYFDWWDREYAYVWDLDVEKFYIYSSRSNNVRYHQLVVDLTDGSSVIPDETSDILGTYHEPEDTLQLGFA